MHPKNTVKKINIIYFILALVISFNITSAQVFKDPILLKGLEKGYNFNFIQADSLLNHYSDIYPDSLKGEFLKTKFKLWKYIGSKDETFFKDFISASDLLITKLDNIIDASGENAETLYLIASLYASKTIALSANYEIVDAFWNAKKAMSYLEDLIEDYPSMKESYLEMGILTYALSYVEGIATVALTLSGMEADRALGIEMLTKAHEGNLYAKVESSFYLSQVLSEFTADHEKAIKYLNPVVQKFPNNILFSFQLAVLYSKNKEFQKSKDNLRKILKNESEVFPQTIAFSNFLMGDILLLEENYRDADRYFDLFLESSNDINYSSKAYYQKALCNLFGNQKFLYHRNLASTNLGNLENADDKFARRRSQELQLNKISESLKNLLKSELSLKAGKINQTKNYLSDIKKENLSTELKYLEQFLQIKLMYQTNSFSSFKQKCTSLLSKDIESEQWIIPYTNILLAEVYFLEKNYEKSAEFLEEAEDENDYDFRNEIMGRINQLKIKLDNRNYR